MNKRSDFPCPGVIRSGDTDQGRQSRRISDHFAEKLDRSNTPAARERKARNEDYLAAKRRNPTKSIRKSA